MLSSFMNKANSITLAELIALVERRTRIRTNTMPAGVFAQV